MTISKSSLDFLENLKKNNHRDWMTEHKKEYLASEHKLKAFYKEVEQGLNRFDEIEKVKVFRINRDIRFSKDKTPYNVHRSAGFRRLGAQRRGSYYLRIEPNNESAIGCGFFGPEAADLKRIRTEFQMDATEIRAILAEPIFKKIFGGAFMLWDPLKTAPRGFDKDDPNIDLIRLKSFTFMKRFTDAEILAPDFKDKIVAYYELCLPFLNYMSDILTTDLNGESLLEQ